MRDERFWRNLIIFGDIIIEAFHLACPIHGLPLRREADQLLCERGDAFSIIEGVAMLIEGVRVERLDDSQPEAVIDALIDAFGMPPTNKPALERIFRHRFSFVEDWIQVEADQFVHRVAASHEGLRAALHISAAVPASDIPVNLEPSPRISSLFRLTKLRPNDLATMNVRVHNGGRSTLSSNHPNPIHLAYHWTDQNGRVEEGNRTKLLDDIVPGQSMTVPIFINTPQRTGSFKLRIRALQEGVAWFDETTVDCDVEIAEGSSTIDDPEWPKTGKQFDYFYDHQEALRLIEEWRHAHFKRPVDVMVELGGNCSPMLIQMQAPYRFNVDVDPFGMIVGKLMHGPNDSELNYVVADGMALPFPPRSIDILMMFATFHHFPDPVGLLSRLKDFVADDGLICLLCEPLGHPHADTVEVEYVAELRRGVNEQSFTLWEYKQMFDAVALDVVTAQIDVGSAKFALRPRR